VFRLKGRDFPIAASPVHQVVNVSAYATEAYAGTDVPGRFVISLLASVSRCIRLLFKQIVMDPCDLLPANASASPT